MQSWNMNYMNDWFHITYSFRSDIKDDKPFPTQLYVKKIKYQIYLIKILVWFRYPSDMLWPRNIILNEPSTTVSSISILSNKQLQQYINQTSTNKKHTQVWHSGPFRQFKTIETI